jgi:hypothetical protein
MPQKTLYVRDADLPIWEAAEKQLGAKSMSTLVIEALQEKLDRKDGFLNIIRSSPGIPLTNSQFAVMFAAVDGPGGAMKPRYCASLDGLKALLKLLGITDRAIAGIVDDLGKKYSADVRVTLTNDKLALIAQDIYVVRIRNGPGTGKFMVLAPFAGAHGLGPNHGALDEQEVRTLLAGEYMLSAPEIESLLKIVEDNPVQR